MLSEIICAKRQEVRTFIHNVKFRDNMKANFGMFILEHLKEHGEEMGDGPLD